MEKKSNKPQLKTERNNQQKELVWMIFLSKKESETEGQKRNAKEKRKNSNGITKWYKLQKQPENRTSV